MGAALSEYGKTVDQLIRSTNKSVILETTDGVRREGRLSGWTTMAIQLNGDEVHIPLALELNGDPNDAVALDRIRKIQVKS